MRDSCSLFQARESKSIDTMASLVTDTVPGAGKFSLKSLRSKFQDFFFSFYPEASFGQQKFLAPILSLLQGWVWGLELRDTSDGSCHIAVDFSTAGENAGAEV